MDESLCDMMDERMMEPLAKPQRVKLDTPGLEVDRVYMETCEGYISREVWRTDNASIRRVIPPEWYCLPFTEAQWWVLLYFLVNSADSMPLQVSLDWIAESLDTRGPKGDIIAAVYELRRAEYLTVQPGPKRTANIYTLHLPVAAHEPSALERLLSRFAA